MWINLSSFFLCIVAYKIFVGYWYLRRHSRFRWSLVSWSLNLYEIKMAKSSVAFIFQECSDTYFLMDPTPFSLFFFFWIFVCFIFRVLSILILLWLNFLFDEDEINICSKRRKRQCSLENKCGSRTWL